MDFEEIRMLTSSAEASTSVTRDEASNMLIFGRISQWDDVYANSVLTEYRGQFDLIKPKRNRILAELYANPVSVGFKAKDGAKVEDAEVLDGMFRTDMIASEEALENSLMDQVDCGFGAFRFVTEYESSHDDLNNFQRIKAVPIFEANNRVWFDDNANCKDKSDANWVLIVTPFTKDGWKTYALNNGIDYKEHETPSSFTRTNTSRSWFLRNDTKSIDIGEFYQRKKVRKRVLIYQDPLGQRKSYYQEDIKEVEQELEDSGFVKIKEKYKDRYVIYKYLLDGMQVIKKQKIAGSCLPVIPVFGDWSYVEKREIWRGIYYDAQDAQRLHNFQMSYLADVIAKGPREKPIFTPEQIQGFEYMYHLNGADNNFPYLLAQAKDSAGNPLPVGPQSYLKNPDLPQATAAILEYTRRSVDDVTGGGASGEAMINSQVTEGQIHQVQRAQNMETFLYQNNYQLAMKHAGRVYASMASELYDVPRTVVSTLFDGTEKEIMLMESVVDYETGEEVVLNDITRGSFDVYSDTTPNYTTQKDQVRSEMQAIFQALPDSEVGNMALMTYLMALDGPDTKPLREYARKQMVLNGQIEPETEEEKQSLVASQQPAGPDPATILSMAENKKADAAIITATTKQQDTQIKAYDAETRRAKAISEGEMTQAEIEKAATEISGNELDNIQKLAQAFGSRTLQ